MKLNPYIHFAGNAEEALNFYVKALGGNIQRIGRYGESPVDTVDDWKEKILHSRLEFDGNIVMISDSFKDQPVSSGGNIQLSIAVDSIEKLNVVFDSMSEGGTVTMPLQDTFWGARFGMLKDKFGIGWMFSCELPQQT